MKILIIILLINFVPLTIIGQGFPEDRVYGGAGFIYTLNGLSRNDEVYYFRKDGSFVDDLMNDGWQTRNTGNYKLINNKVILDFLDTEQLNDTLEFDDKIKDMLWSGGTQLVEMIIPNKLPKGVYEYSNASSSGGMGTGMAYVGTQFLENLFVLEDGRFTRDISSGVVVIGNSIGGGTSNDDNSSGSYTLNNGVLILTYDNGKVEKTNVFYSNNMLTAPEDDFMVSLGGYISFYKTFEDYQKQNQDETDTNQNSIDSNHNENNYGLKNESIRTLLQKMKQKHGGIKIDSIKTIEAHATVYNINFRLYLDVENQYYRLQSFDSSINFIEQYGAGSGWIQQDGVSSPLTPERQREIALLFSSGILGLKKENIEDAKILGEENVEDNTVVLLELQHTKLGYIIDAKNFLMQGYFIFKNGKQEVTYNYDFKTVNGILLPMKEISEIEGSSTIETRYSRIIINPIFPKNFWQRP